MKRRNAELRPYAIGAGVVDGVDTYVPDPGIALADASRWWTFGGVVRTVQRKTGEYVKGWSGFRGASTDEMKSAIDEMRAEAGISMPTGYADAFRARYTTPRLSPSFQIPMLPVFRGGWQEALRAGTHPGVWKLYDLRQAYLWALTEGLPDPAYFHRTKCLTYRNTLYRVRLNRVEPSAPYPFSRELDVLATGEEIGYYGLDVEEVLDGIAFRRAANVTKIFDAVTFWSFYKQVARAYWGAWASTARVECHTLSKSWELPPMGANIVWAHLIVSRVKRRLADVCRGAVHVFVDSVLTQDTISTGENMGDWRLVKEYTDGVNVLYPGVYGPAGKALDKYAGVAVGDPRRMGPFAA